jgi:TolA-binding protein
LDAVTYPQNAVKEAIDAHCVPLKIDNGDTATAPILQKYRHIWTPDLHILEADGNELYRWNGYLPPFEFAPQLLAAVAQAHLRLKRFDSAIDMYEDVLKRFATSLVAPEAQYFLAVSKYRKTHESSELMRGWHELEKTFPASEWTVKQNF